MTEMFAPLRASDFRIQPRNNLYLQRSLVLPTASLLAANVGLYCSHSIKKRRRSRRFHNVTVDTNHPLARARTSVRLGRCRSTRVRLPLLLFLLTEIYYRRQIFLALIASNIPVTHEHFDQTE